MSQNSRCPDRIGDVDDDDAATGKARSKKEPELWDIATSPRKEGLFLYISLMANVCKILTFGAAGLFTLVAGFVMAKVCANLFGYRSADSFFMKDGCRYFLMGMGVYSTVHYEPVLDSGETVDTFNQWKARRRARDMRLTPVIVSNHVSYIDGPVLAPIFGSPRLVAMSGSLNAPIFGRLIQECDPILVDRSNPDSRRESLSAIEAHCRNWKPGERPLMVFPEGTVTHGGCLKEFKRGAFVAGTPVRPVLVVHTGRWVPAATSYWRAADGSLKQDSLKQWVLQYLSHLFFQMHIFVLPPYLPSPAEQSDPDLYCNNVRAHMATNLERVRATVLPKAKLHQG